MKKRKETRNQIKVQRPGFRAGIALKKSAGQQGYCFAKKASSCGRRHIRGRDRLEKAKMDRAHRRIPQDVERGHDTDE